MAWLWLRRAAAEAARHDSWSITYGQIQNSNWESGTLDRDPRRVARAHHARLLCIRVDMVPALDALRARGAALRSWR